MQQLSQDFEKSVHYVKHSKDGKKLSNQIKLQMYALYKQATQGDVAGEKPGMFDMVSLAKYTAWEKLQGVSANDAMQSYISQVTALEGPSAT